MTASVNLSVVVALISGENDDLHRCLSALASQTFSGALEILVPYDPPCEHVLSLSDEFPDAQFIAVEHLDTVAARAGASREHHDSLRTVGIRAASGDAIALTEDHAIAGENWCEKMLALLSRNPSVAAIGGAVECRSNRLLNQAVYLSDFGRYQNPLKEGSSPFVSDSNVIYSAKALHAISDVWADDYHETLVHDALTEREGEIWLTPQTIVHQERSHLSWGMALKERFVWARSYAGTRVRVLTSARRLIMIALSYSLPPLMTWRILRGLMQRKRLTLRHLLVLPLVLILQTAWGIGEFVGYLTGKEKQ